MLLIESRILLASAASLLVLNACNPGDPSKSAAPSQNAVVATVNGTAISANRVDTLVKQLAAQGQPESPEARKEIVDHLAMQMLGSQEAIKKGLDKSPEVLDRLDLARQSILFNAFIQDALKNNPVSDDLLKAEYDKIKAQLSGSEYKSRHILLDKEDESKDIIATLKKNPKAFAALAKEKSKDPGSGSKGGDLGWFDPNGMVPEFGAAVAKLEKNKFTEEPVKSKFGYHVILLEDSRPNPKQLPPFEQIKPALKQQVQQQSVKKLLEDMKSKATITMVEAPAATPKKDDKQDVKPAEPAAK